MSSQGVALNYKESKRVLRKAQRHAQFIYESKYIEKIEKSENIDSKLFWHLINKRIKPRSISCNPLKKTIANTCLIPQRL